jgi:signal peptidase II
MPSPKRHPPEGKATRKGPAHLVWHRKRKLFLLSTLLCLFVDQFSKSLLYSTPGTRPPVILVRGLFEIRSASNFGGLFGVGQGKTWFFALFSLAAIVYLMYFLVRTDPGRSLPNLAVGILMGGAIGNLYDRLALGYVRDFIYMYYRSYHWPNYNMADVFICLGIGLMILEVLFSKEPAASGDGGDESAEGKEGASPSSGARRR